LKTFQIYKSLDWLNSLPAHEAETAFLDCCGSQRWAQQMAAKRPFKMLDDLYSSAEALWFSSTPSDWLEAFAAHPKIGSSASNASNFGKWSGEEQAKAAAASLDVKEQLAKANRLYEERFGFIFIVCATGRTAEDLLANCVDRLRNPMADEIKVAAMEQHKITVLRLNKLLEK
jgi:OHCU decarboxylase